MSNDQQLPFPTWFVVTFMVLAFTVVMNLLRMSNNANVRTCIKQCMANQPVQECNAGCRLNQTVDKNAR